MFNISYKKLGGALLVALLVMGCEAIEEEGICPPKSMFTLQDDRKTLVAKGEITAFNLTEFKDLIAKHPHINRINIDSIPGSCDDEANFKLMQLIRTQQIHTHINDDGYVASGGTDFFIAGAKRSIGKNTQIGVHAWAMGFGSFVQTGKDFPKGHAYHQAYINIYKALGYSDEWAKAFYYFTIDKAEAQGMYYLTQEDIKRFGLVGE